MEENISIKRRIVALILLITAIYFFFIGIIYLTMVFVIIDFIVLDQIKKEDILELVDYLKYVVKKKVFKSYK